MPIYTYICDECEASEEIFELFNKYESIEAICPKCSQEMSRDFSADTTRPQPKTLGMLADLNASRKGYDNCIQAPTQKRD